MVRHVQGGKGELQAAVELLQGCQDGQADAQVLEQVLRTLPATLSGCRETSQLQDTLATLQVCRPKSPPVRS